jgi:hypothetical protein
VLFYDPISDLALLGPPDGQELYYEAEAYEAFVDSRRPAPMSEAGEEGEAWLLSLENVWFRGRFERIDWGPMWVSKLEGSIRGGMSGSPILNSEGAAIGVVNLGNMSPTAHIDDPDPQTVLYRNLPRFML